MDETTAYPYNTLGTVSYSGQWFGSGVVTGSPYAFYTASHVSYSYATGWVDEVTWSSVNASNSVPVRNFRRIESYADAVDLHGENSVITFSRDVALGFAYERLSDEVATLSSDAIADLTSSKPKILTGFPGTRSRLSQSGPFNTAFRKLYQDYHSVAFVNMGAGGSGGGVWVQSGNTWNLAGTYVSGGSIYAGAVALSDSKKALLESVLDLLDFSPPAILSQPDSINIVWGEAAELRIEYEGSPAPTLTWERREGSSFYSWTPTAPVVPGVAVLVIGANELVPLNREFRLKLTNENIATYSEWIPVVYTNGAQPYLINQPEDLYLEEGQSGSFVAEVGSNPPATLQWQILSDRGHFYDLNLSDFTDAETEKLTVVAADAYYDGVQYRLKASNIFGERFSDPVTLHVPSPSFSAFYRNTIPDLLANGESVRIELGVSSDSTVVRWELTYPDGSIRSSSHGGYISDVSWLKTDETGATITNNGLILNGAKLRAIVYNQRDHFYGRPDEILELGAFEIWADVPPRVLAQPSRFLLGDGQKGAELSYRATRGSSVEWQVKDEEASVWRPIQESDVWQTSDDGSRSRIIWDGGELTATLRAVIRSEGYAPVLSDPTSVSFLSSLTLPFEAHLYDVSGYSVRASTHLDGKLLTLIKEKSDVGYKIITLDPSDGTTSSQDLILDSGYLQSSIHEMTASDGLLALASSHPEDDVEYHSGTIILLNQNVSGEWELYQELRLPVQSKAGDFPRSLRFIDGTLVATSLHTPSFPFETIPPVDRLYPHLFHRGSDGKFSYIRSLKEGDADLPLDWSGYADIPISFRNGMLFVGINKSLPYLSSQLQLRHNLVYLEYSSALEAYTIKNMGKTYVVPSVAVRDEELWAISTKFPSLDEHWYRVLINESGDISEQTNQVAPTLLGEFIKSSGPLVWTRSSASDGYLAGVESISFYRLNEDGSHSGPALFAPDDWAFSRSYSNGEVFFGEEVVFIANLDTLSGQWRVDSLRINDLVFDTLCPRPSKWFEVKASESGEGWLLNYREAKLGEPVTNLQSSIDLLNWQEWLNFDRAVVDDDVDGDGLTQLIEVNLPGSSSSGPVFYQISEE